MDSDPRRQPGPIVVGVDGSPSALMAVRWAAREAAFTGSGLRLVHVLTTSAGRAESLMRAAESVARRTHQGLAIESATIGSPARTTLLRESRTAALIVFGASGHGPLLGPAAITLSLRGGCPVVVVRDAIPETGPVVVGVNDWADCAAAARFAFQRAALYGTGVTAVRAWAAPATPDTMAIRSKEHAALAAELSTLADEFADIPVKHVLVRGRAGGVLLDYGERARLIVVGPHGRAGFPGVAAGSATGQWGSGLACPIAIVPTEASPGPAAGAARTGP
ncbi:universal stress protein [Amycolatopsis sp. K13G38]|uniref:Universal stress protein n=1 Tax=Amycolatopsis acididurans TaxID=2724524 RepID=A0ABX1IZB1_9PSEU|nr:universal stress protein [Amycolatopsis acididurans]NKQ52059.1 universal stress protein [Amycolatopsis acididurans]